MVREGKWTLSVLVNGAVQPEHQVDGRTVVEARPGCKFTVRVQYHGSELHQLELFVDGKSVSGRKYIDGEGCTTFFLALAAHTFLRNPSSSASASRPPHAKRRSTNWLSLGSSKQPKLPPVTKNGQ